MSSSSTFRKMLLVSEEELDRIKARQLKEHDPSLKAMVRIQDQIENILNDPSFSRLHPDERLQIYDKLYHRFSQLRNGVTASSYAGEAGFRKFMPEEEKLNVEKEEEENAKQQMTSSLPTKMEIPSIFGVSSQNVKKAEQLAQYVFRDPNSVSINNQNELVVEGKPVRGSNVIDLIADVYSTSKSKIHGPRPVGFHEFLNVLNKLNTPRTLLVNPVYHDAYVKAEPTFAQIEPQPPSSFVSQAPATSSSSKRTTRSKSKRTKKSSSTPLSIYKV